MGEAFLVKRGSNEIMVNINQYVPESGIYRKFVEPTYYYYSKDRYDFVAPRGSAACTAATIKHDEVNQEVNLFVAGGTTSQIDVYTYDNRGNLQRYDSHMDLNLSSIRTRLAAGNVGEYVLFAGGLEQDITDVVDVVYYNGYQVYDSLKLSEPRIDIVSASTSEKVYFIGGSKSLEWEWWWGDPEAISNTIDVYNRNLIHSQLSDLNGFNYRGAATVLEDKVYYGAFNQYEIIIIDDTEVMFSVDNIQFYPECGYGAAATKDYAIFACYTGGDIEICAVNKDYVGTNIMEYYYTGINVDTSGVTLLEDAIFVNGIDMVSVSNDLVITFLGEARTEDVYKENSVVGACGDYLIIGGGYTDTEESKTVSIHQMKRYYNYILPNLADYRFYEVDITGYTYGGMWEEPIECQLEVEVPIEGYVKYSADGRINNVR